MKRWLKQFFLAIGILVILAIVAVVGLYWNQHRTNIRDAEQKISQWKTVDWKTSQNLDLLANAIVAAEDPQFFTDPKLACGIMDLLKRQAHCSPILTHASRIITSETLGRPLRRILNEISVQTEFAKQPREALDIVLNKTYLGPKENGDPIEGFSQASQFYFGKNLETLKVSEVALLAGMMSSPTRFSPKKEPVRARERRDLVIDRMAQMTFITSAEADAAKRDALP